MAPIPSGNSAQGVRPRRREGAGEPQDGSKANRAVESVGLIGRLSLIGALLYVLGGGLLSAARIALTGLAGHVSDPQQISAPVRTSIARCTRAAPVAAAGLALMLTAAVARGLRRRRAARATSDGRRG